MINIEYSEYFLRKYSKIKKRDLNLSKKIIEKIELLKDINNHKALEVHKLKSPYKNTFSFSVNYKIRIIFEYTKNKEIIILLTLGNHDIY